MFTLGREREKKHAEGYVTKPGDLVLIHAMIDAAHDVLEGAISADAAIPILIHSFVNGGSGAWEQTGQWICKLTGENSTVAGAWTQMAGEASARVRFRVAAFLADMPSSIRAELFPLFLNDRSPKIRLKVAGDCGVTPKQGDLALLTARRGLETDALVLEALDYAITAIRNANGRNAP